jgi:hypothetical protein
VIDAATEIGCPACGVCHCGELISRHAIFSSCTTPTPMCDCDQEAVAVAADREQEEQARRAFAATPHCPWCMSTDLDATFVDIGVGMQRVTPYRCNNCDALEIGHWSGGDEEERRCGWFRGEIGARARAALSTGGKGGA